MDNGILRSSGADFCFFLIIPGDCSRLHYASTPHTDQSAAPLTEHPGPLTESSGPLTESPVTAQMSLGSAANISRIFFFSLERIYKHRGG